MRIPPARPRLVSIVCLVLASAPASVCSGQPQEVPDLSAFIRDYLGAEAKKEAFEFAVISDTHIGSDDGAVKNMKALLADIRETAKVDFVINTGDVTEGKTDQAEKYMAIFREHLGRTRHIAAMGNHDREGKPVMDGLYGIDCVGEAARCNYSFDYGRLHFTVVHNGQRELLHPVNKEFMAADFAAAKGRPTLLFYHIHVMCPTPGQAHLSYMGQGRYRALGFLRQFPQVKGCFAGHDHAFWHGRYFEKNFFSTVGSWYQCGGTRNGWWWLRADGEKITVRRKEIGKPAVAMPAWEQFPPYPTAMLNAEQTHGRIEIPLFTERLTAEGYYWGTRGRAGGPRRGVRPVAGEKMICCMELNSSRGLLGLEDYELVGGEKLAYWMFVPPGCEQWDFGAQLPARGFDRLKDHNGLPAVLKLKPAGISPGNWLYREIPLRSLKGWFSSFTAATPGPYARWPTANLRSSYRLFLDEVRILRPGRAAAPPAAVPEKVENLKPGKVGAGYVLLTWKAAKGAHHYRVEREDRGERHFLGTSPNGRFYDFTVRPGAEYEYHVAAVNAHLAKGPPQTLAVKTAEADPPPPKVTGLKGAFLPKGRFILAGTWQQKPAVHISWDGKADWNDLAVRAYRVYRTVDGEKTLFAETIGRFALIDEGKLGEKLAVAGVNHSGREGPAAEIEITQTWKGPGQAFHLRTGEEESGQEQPAGR